MRHSLAGVVVNDFIDKLKEKYWGGFKMFINKKGRASQTGGFSIRKVTQIYLCGEENRKNW